MIVPEPQPSSSPSPSSLLPFSVLPSPFSLLPSSSPPPFLHTDKADDLTFKGKDKHFIGDFLPPEELEKFQEKVQAVKEDRDPDFSDYSKHKITEENIGFQMLQSAGWTAGSGLGSKGEGIQAPINKCEYRAHTHMHTDLHTHVQPLPFQREAVLPAGRRGHGEGGRGGQRRQ